MWMDSFLKSDKKNKVTRQTLCETITQFIFIAKLILSIETNKNITFSQWLKTNKSLIKIKENNDNIPQLKFTHKTITYKTFRHAINTFISLMQNKNNIENVT